MICAMIHVLLLWTDDMRTAHFNCQMTRTCVDLVGGFDHLKNIQNGNLHQTGGKIKNIWNHNLVMLMDNWKLNLFHTKTLTSLLPPAPERDGEFPLGRRVAPWEK